MPDLYNPSTWIGVDVPGFGLVVFLVFTAVVGALTKNLFGRQIVLMGERWVDRMPIVRSVYNGVKQIIETVLTQSSGASFKQSCLIEYPRRACGRWRSSRPRPAARCPPASPPSTARTGPPPAR